MTHQADRLAKDAGEFVKRAETVYQSPKFFERLLPTLK